MPDAPPTDTKLSGASAIALLVAFFFLPFAAIQCDGKGNPLAAMNAAGGSGAGGGGSATMEIARATGLEAATGDWTITMAGMNAKPDAQKKQNEGGRAPVELFLLPLVAAIALFKIGRDWPRATPAKPLLGLGALALFVLAAQPLTSFGLDLRAKPKANPGNPGELNFTEGMTLKLKLLEGYWIALAGAAGLAAGGFLGSKREEQGTLVEYRLAEEPLPR